MDYCYTCGTRLEKKYLEREGDIPYCPACKQFRFPIFNTAVSMEVLNPAHTKVLLIQQYGRARNILVAGYVNRGERAEHAVAREVREEIGVEVRDIHFERSCFFEPSNTLMLNFSCTAETDDLSHLTTEEVDRAAWYPLGQAQAAIAPKSLAGAFLTHFLRRIGKSVEEYANTCY